VLKAETYLASSIFLATMVARTRNEGLRSHAETKGRRQQPRAKEKTGALNSTHAHLTPTREESRLPTERSKRASNRDTREESGVHNVHQRSKSASGGRAEQNRLRGPDCTREDHHPTGRVHQVKNSRHNSNGQQSTMLYKDHGYPAKKPSQRHLLSNSPQVRKVRDASPTKTRILERAVREASPARGRIIERTAREASSARGRNPERTAREARPSRGRSHKRTVREAHPSKGRPSPERTIHPASATKIRCPERTVHEARAGKARNHGTAERPGPPASTKTRKSKNIRESGVDKPQNYSMEQCIKRDQIKPTNAKQSSSEDDKFIANNTKSQEKNKARARRKGRRKGSPGDFELVTGSPEKNKKASTKSKKGRENRGWMRNPFRRKKHKIKSPTTDVPVREGFSPNERAKTLSSERAKTLSRERASKTRAKSIRFADSEPQLSAQGINTDKPGEELKFEEGSESSSLEFLPGRSGLQDFSSIVHAITDGKAQVTAGYNGVVGSVEYAATSFYTKLDRVLDVMDPKFIHVDDRE
jgi:hypothetical protein